MKSQEIIFVKKLQKTWAGDIIKWLFQNFYLFFFGKKCNIKQLLADKLPILIQKDNIFANSS